MCAPRWIMDVDLVTRLVARANPSRGPATVDDPCRGADDEALDDFGDCDRECAMHAAGSRSFGDDAVAMVAP
eukprot:1707932-Prymnesium_polylepis.1